MAVRFSISNLLLLLLLLALGVGFFLTIHTIDVFRQQEELVVREIKGIRSEIGEIQASFERFYESGGVVARQAASAGTSKQTSVSSVEPKPRFANLQARDPNAEEGDHIVLNAYLEAQNMNYIIAGGPGVDNYWKWTLDSLAEHNL